MIIGVTGFFAAGKDTVAEYLMNKGFAHVSLSDIIRDEIRDQGLEITIPRLTATGNALRTGHGPGVLAERALERLPRDTDSVVTSIRHTAEIAALRARPDFLMVFTDAPIRTRYERSTARARSGDPVSFEEFEESERLQMESADPNAQQLAACREAADIVIQNDSTLEALHAAIERLLEEHRA